jgi:hypothetical protein
LELRLDFGLFGSVFFAAFFCTGEPEAVTLWGQFLLLH